MESQIRSLSGDILAITSLPMRWLGAPPLRIAEDIAASLAHLCPELLFVGVRIELPPSKPVVVRVPRDGPDRGWPADDMRLVTAQNEICIRIGSLGKYGEIVIVAPHGADTARVRLISAIAANQISAACHTLDLERDIAQAHEKVAALGKLSALGQLVGGVAHEIRTPLTYAMNNLYTLRRRLEASPERASHEESVREIEEALDRIAGIVNQLRRLSRQDHEMRIEEDARDLVHDAVRLWRATHAGDCEVAESLRPTPPISADRGQLQQVILNLVQNAADAMKGSGVVRISTGEEGGDAVIVIEDDGPGIPPEILSDLYQPFRTTKPEGLGLGLSIVRGIVKAHRGSIDVDSAPGRGTRIVVRIPRAPLPVADGSAAR